MAKKIIFSLFLVLVVLTSSVYFLMPDKIRIDIGKTNTIYYVWQNDWVLAATEYVNLYDGTTKMRAKSRELKWFNDSENVYAKRISIWKDNITTTQTYIFSKTEDQVEQFPARNEFQCINCEDKIVHYEIRNILYEGETKEIDSPFSFGNNMKIEWEQGNYYSKVFQQIVSDKIIIKYRPQSANETYLVRLFDPVDQDFNVTITINTSFNFYPDNLTHKGVEPVNQTDLIGVFTAHNNLTGDISVWAKLNDTSANVTLKIGNNSTYANSISINTSYQILYENLSIDSTIYLWAWADYNNLLQPWYPELEIKGETL